MRILVIAPDSNLGGSLPLQQSEVIAVVNTKIPTKVLSGPNISHADITNELERAVREKEPFTVWWFMGHGFYEPTAPVWKNGIALSNTILTLQQLAVLARIHQPSLIYLNTCASVFLGNLIMEECGADVIVTLGTEIEEAAAVEMAVAYANRLAIVGDFRQAYEDVRPPSNVSFLYITSWSRRIALDDQRLLEKFVTKDELRSVYDQLMLKIAAQEAKPSVIAPQDGSFNMKGWLLFTQIIFIVQLLAFAGFLTWILYSR